MHLIAQLKQNHPNLCEKADAPRAAAEPLSSVRTVDAKARNRHETRTITVFDATTAVEDTQWKTHVRAIIHVEREVNARSASTGLWKSSCETSIYLSSRPVTAEIAGDAIRKHGGIENTSHYTRDVTFLEDASRIRKNPGIFARMRSLAYNVLRCNKSDTTPRDRFASALGGIEAMFKMKFSIER